MLRAVLFDLDDTLIDWSGFNVTWNDLIFQQMRAVYTHLSSTVEKVPSHKEIAEMLGISDGTSKWHLSFARNKLKEMLARKQQSETKGHRSDFRPLPTDR